MTVREAIGDLPVLEFQKRTGEYKIITDTPVYRYDPFCDYQVQHILYFSENNIQMNIFCLYVHNFKYILEGN